MNTGGRRPARIRTGRSADLSVLAPIAAPDWSASSVEHALRERDVAVAVADDGDDGDAGAAPVGFVITAHAGDEADLLLVSVAPAHRRRGLGAELVRATEARAIAAGVARIFLEVRASNTAALALYRACGYRPVGQRPRYYADGEDAVVMRHDLAPSPHATD